MATLVLMMNIQSSSGDITPKTTKLLVAGTVQP